MSVSEKDSWEKDLLEKFVLNVQKEQIRDRRWRIAMRFMKLFGLVLVIGSVVWFSANPKNLERFSTSVPHTAYINIRGEIAAGKQADADLIIPAIKAAFDNENAKALVIRINSPGGSPVQAGRIYEEVKAQHAQHPDKPVYAVIDDLGASGGYYIAASADKIFADRASLVGSIGVISSGFGFSELMSKLGIERRAITSGEHKAFLDPFSPLTPEVEKFWRDVLSTTHKQFIARVKEGRGDRLSSDPELFSGLLWNGEQAVANGLIDDFGSLQSVARNVVKEPKLVDYTPTPDILQQLTDRTAVSVATAFNTAKISVY